MEILEFLNYFHVIRTNCHLIIRKKKYISHNISNKQRYNQKTQWFLLKWEINFGLNIYKALEVD